MLKVRKSSLSEELRINARGALETTNQNVTSNGIIRLWDPKAEPHSVRDIIHIVEEGKRVKNLQYAKCLEVQISDVGLQDHATVGNHVLGMLLACGSASDAQQVFNNLSYRDEHSWTSLMLEYIKSGQSKHAFRLYQRMQDDHVICSSFTLMALLKACVRTKDVDKGREAHAKIKEKGLENDIFVGSTLVDMYVKCGSLAEAQDVFDKLPARNVVSWTALINGYAEHGFGHEALRRFQEMLRDGVSPNPITLICSLKACGSIGAIDKGREIHSRIAEKGLERDISVVTSLVDMYIKCNSSLEAQKAFDKLPVQNVVSWTTLIKGYVEHGFEQDALKCFEKMQLEGVHPNAFTFLSGLKACNNLGAITNGRELHAEIVQRGLAGDPFIGNALVDMYTGFGLFAEGENIFDNLLVQDVVSWTTLIGGYAEAGFALEALKCFEQMQSEGILPNAVTYVCSLKACGCIGAIDRARKIHNDIAQGGLEKDPFVGSSLVDFYAKHGSLAEAREIFDKLPFRDATVWNSLIARHSENGLDLHALKFFEDMQAENICPNPVTFVCILKACGNMRAGERGQEIHASITQMGLERDLFVGNALIDMYAKCGLLMSAMHVFDSMPVRDVVSWNALISGHSECGLFKEAIQCFEHMHLEGIPLTISTFVSALQACKHLGVVKKVQEIHNEAAKEGFESNPFLGNALIDIYACYGLFEKAQEVFNKLPAQDALSWSALIAGYAENGFSVEALQCFEKMKSSGMSPNAIAFVYGLKACGSLRHAYGGKVLHALIIQRNFHGNPVLGNALIDMYTKCSLLLEAQDVFGRMPVHDIITWTAIFAGRIEQDPGVDIPKYVEFMQLEGANLDTIAFISCLKACANTGFVHNVQHIHKEIVRKGFGKDLFIGTTLIDVYGKLGAILEAEEVFNNLPVRNVLSWN